MYDDDHICNRCNKKFYNNNYILKTSYYDYVRKNEEFTLCEACLHKVESFIKGDFDLSYYDKKIIDLEKHNIELGDKLSSIENRLNSNFLMTKVEVKKFIKNLKEVKEFIK